MRIPAKVCFVGIACVSWATACGPKRCMEQPRTGREITGFDAEWLGKAGDPVTFDFLIAYPINPSSQQVQKKGGAHVELSANTDSSAVVKEIDENWVDTNGIPSDPSPHSTYSCRLQWNKGIIGMTVEYLNGSHVAVPQKPYYLQVVKGLYVCKVPSTQPSTCY